MLDEIALSIGVCFFLLSPFFAGQKGSEPTAPPQEAVFDVGPGISPPQAIFMPDPDYPPSFRKRKIQGICILAVTVDNQGTVQEVRVTRSLDKRLDQNAIDAIKRWKFKSAMRDGKPVSVRTSIEVGFRLY